MQTNTVIDENLIKETLKLSGLKTKKEGVNLALKEFVESIKRKNLLKLKGKIEFDVDYDYKEMRERK